MEVMYRIKYFGLLFLFTSFGDYFNTAAQSAMVEIHFTASDGVVGNQLLKAGLDPTATDGLDTHLGESELPPLPPSGVFDARFILPSSTIGSHADYRQGDSTVASIGVKEHEVRYQLGSGSTGFTITYNMPAGTQLRLRDNFGGVFYDIDNISGAGSYTVTNLGLNVMLVTIKYIDPPFPVELTSFSGYAAGNTVRLSWKTATEVNNLGFDVERKNPQGKFERIGFVEGAGNSNSPNSYTFEDNSISIPGRYAYRLKQNDFNGDYKYSNIIYIDINLPLVTKLHNNYPNPFNPVTKIKFEISASEKVNMKLFDSVGREVVELFNDYFNPGYHFLDISLQDFASGIYYLVMQAGEFTDSKKLVFIK